MKSKLFNIINEDREEKNGGSSDINILIVSHNARMRCLLNKILGNLEKIAKFQNCAIVKIQLNYNDLDTIELFYEGELSESEKGTKKSKKEEDKTLYFTNKNKESDPKIKYVIFSKKTLDIKTNMGLNKLKKDYTIYVVRHGQAEHNTLKGIKYEKLFNYNKYLDANLTKNGEEQAMLANYKIKNIHFDYLFVSKLRRTIETGRILLANNNNLIEKPIVLPCSYELNYTNKKDCDEADNGILKNYFPPENISICDNIKSRSKNKCDNDINWNYYDTFIANEKNNKAIHLKCKDTNMIEQVFNYLDNKSY
jgi:broad specificity phosphatase PhoE